MNPSQKRNQDSISIERGRSAYISKFGRAPRWIARAPGRVNLIGEHVDYNDGVVLPMGIEAGVTIAAAPALANRARFWSDEQGEECAIALDAPLVQGAPDWGNYLRGVLAGFLERGAVIPGFDAVVTSTVPPGGGLSSSAALEVAAATLLEAITGMALEPAEKALLCQRAEREWAGVPCGIMDQFASVFAREGCALLLDCRSREVEWIPFGGRETAILIVNTNVRHSLGDGAYAERLASCEGAARLLGLPALRDATLAQIEAGRAQLGAIRFRRARHVVTEIARTFEAAAALRAGQWERTGELMFASHESLRRDYEVSCPELDAVVEIAGQLGLGGGVFGCRMTGGGFGGCAVALIEATKAREISAAIDEGYRRRTGRAGSLFTTRPGSGAAVIFHQKRDELAEENARGGGGSRTHS